MSDTRPVCVVQIGRLRPINPAKGNLRNYPWGLAFDLEPAFRLCNISSKEINNQGNNSCESDMAWSFHIRVGSDCLGGELDLLHHYLEYWPVVDVIAYLLCERICRCGHHTICNA